jgi:hypothetical protein
MPSLASDAIGPSDDLKPAITTAIIGATAIARALPSWRARAATTGRTDIPTLTRELVHPYRPRTGLGIALALVVPVLLIVGLAVPAKRVCPGFSLTRADIAQTVADWTTYEGYPVWQSSHPRGTCADALADLWGLQLDPWGHEYNLRCIPGTQTLVVTSAGEDGVLGTADDITAR